jgi:hypothetical protein
VWPKVSLVFEDFKFKILKILIDIGGQKLSYFKKGFCTNDAKQICAWVETQNIENLSQDLISIDIFCQNIETVCKFHVKNSLKTRQKLTRTNSVEWVVKVLMTVD